MFDSNFVSTFDWLDYRLNKLNHDFYPKHTLERWQCFLHTNTHLWKSDTSSTTTLVERKREHCLRNLSTPLLYIMTEYSLEILRTKPNYFKSLSDAHDLSPMIKDLYTRRKNLYSSEEDNNKELFVTILTLIWKSDNPYVILKFIISLLRNPYVIDNLTKIFYREIRCVFEAHTYDALHNRLPELSETPISNVLQQLMRLDNSSRTIMLPLISNAKKLNDVSHQFAIDLVQRNFKTHAIGCIYLIKPNLERQNIEKTLTPGHYVSSFILPYNGMHYIFNYDPMTTGTIKFDSTDPSSNIIHIINKKMLLSNLIMGNVTIVTISMDDRTRQNDATSCGYRCLTFLIIASMYWVQLNSIPNPNIADTIKQIQECLQHPIFKLALETEFKNILHVTNHFFNDEQNKMLQSLNRKNKDDIYEEDVVPLLIDDDDDDTTTTTTKPNRDNENNEPKPSSSSSFPGDDSNDDTTTTTIQRMGSKRQKLEKVDDNHNEGDSNHSSQQQQQQDYHGDDSDDTTTTDDDDDDDNLLEIQKRQKEKAVAKDSTTKGNNSKEVIDIASNDDNYDDNDNDDDTTTIDYSPISESDGSESTT